MSSVRSSVANFDLKWKKDCEKRVPRYLFKATSNLTSGYISSTAIVPEAIIRKLSRRHPTCTPWATGRDYPSQCSSWTSSLLHVLVQATEMAERLYEPNVCVCILDTRKVRKTTIYPASGMLDGYSYHDDDSKVHETTYLANGTIKNEIEPCFKLVSFENLIEYGLFRFLPQLEDWEDNVTAWQKLNFLRRSLFQNPRQITLSELVQTREIATCFGETLVVPVMVALLSLVGRQKKAWDSFREMLEWTDLVIPDGPLVSRRFMFDQESKHDADELPDIWQFTKVMGDICGYAYPTEYEEAFQELLAQELEEQSVKSEQSDASEQSEDDEGVFEEGVNSLSLAATKVPSPESEPFHPPHEDDRFPVVYPATPTSMIDGEWDSDVHAHGHNGGHCL
ncbi:hypothetical protein FQN54_002764 [Arachnomyces sp. PD_36]|nr:hypothetical protein FQN54_002764 [Arachnomyces sp. PD_36]